MSQDIIGKWYGIGENYILEFAIQNDSIKSQILDSNHDSIGYERGKIKPQGIYNVGDKRIIIIVDEDSNELKYHALTFFNIKDKVSMTLAANGIKSAPSIEEILKLSANDTSSLFGNIFYHQEYIDELTDSKDLETMSVNDFIIFIKTYLSKRDRFLYMEEYMSKTFQDQLTNITLIELGYNPLFRGDWENRFFEKYLLNKDVQELLKKF